MPEIIVSDIAELDSKAKKALFLKTKPDLIKGGEWKLEIKKEDWSEIYRAVCATWKKQPEVVAALNNAKLLKSRKEVEKIIERHLQTHPQDSSEKKWKEYYPVDGEFVRTHLDAAEVVDKLSKILPAGTTIAYHSITGTPPPDGTDISLNTILYGPPGTGKTYHTVTYAAAICNGHLVADELAAPDVAKKKYKKAKAAYDKLVNAGRIAFTTFHQSYEYSDFIEGIKPKVVGNNVTYEVEPGVFRKFCAEAKGKEEPYVFIIDEINRGNISKIFGELITLIEPSKRETQKVTLPLTPEQEFTVPKNVYILGTMNTADRSIAMMDTALRRRFDFVQMAPQPELLPKVKDVDVSKMLRTMNERIEWLYDADHAIGHALFWTLHEKPSLEELARIFRKKIIPQLQEYFHDDYGKVRLVLGESPMIECEPKPGDDLFPGADGLDLPEAIYRVAEADKAVWKDTGTYKKIYK